MDLQTRLLALEEAFWKGDAAFYRDHLTADSLMVFAEPVGVLTKDATVRTISEGARWTAVDLRDARLLRLAPDAAVLTYRAAARRDGDAAPYAALASSAYVRRDDAWRLAFHQQTPVG